MAEPIGPETSRADVLGRLRRERWHAENAHETALVADIDARIARLSAAGTATPPLRETAAAAKPAAQTAARTTPKTPTTRGKTRVRSAR